MDFRGFKWLIQTTDYSPVGAKIGVKIDPDGFHIMKKSQYSGTFGDYSSTPPSMTSSTRTGWRMRRTAMKNKWLAAPYVVWMAIFVVAPLILVVIFAFTDKAGGLTLDNFSNMATYIPAFQHSFVLAIAATLICILIGYPLAYFLSRESLMVRKVAMMLIMLPMWMNFLLRTYAWMSILTTTA